MGIIAAALTGLLAIVVSLPPWPSEPARFVLVSFGSHGVHVGDLPALSLWILGITACVRHWTALGARNGS